MVPPQERPTSQAVSSATPNSSSFGFPLSITSIASVTTAPSTQPPETEPRKLPASSITRFEPTGRGAEPQVSTTVASATLLPSRRQSSAALRMSSSRASIFHLSPIRSFVAAELDPAIHYKNLKLRWMAGSSPAMTDQSPVSRRLFQPRFRVAHWRRIRRQRPAERGHGFQIVDRAEFVNMRQHGPDATRARLKSFEAQQRVEPDQPAAGPVQAVHLEGERVVGVAFEPVGE